MLNKNIEIESFQPISLHHLMNQNSIKHNVSIKFKNDCFNQTKPQTLRPCSFAAPWAARVHSISLESPDLVPPAIVEALLSFFIFAKNTQFYITYSECVCKRRVTAVSLRR